MQEVDHHYADETGPHWLWWLVGIGAASALSVLFFLTWKSQFAAPPGYLFGTPTQAAEAGYCLAVAQDVARGGSLPGSYFDEAAQFWVKRLQGYGVKMGAAISEGRGLLGRDLQATRGPEIAWLREAMDKCSNRAVNYGARFRAFN
ncbi:hypothetical protein RYZ20_00350 [Thioclava sp. A2]|uniref:hypothetical protein n=1 Tax=Thioclava sp. FCG-A2 TaxID=3080562 RepID=UPI002954B5CF|nr:hypothetical protein [Thioclava sp. A2]MDV7269346.1 hypothetical protein [Thioclava sp. A2]